MDSIPAGAIPIDQFQPAEQQPIATAQPDSGTLPSGSIPVDQFESQEDVYGTPSQQLKAGLEGAGKGILGAGAPYLEKKLGVKPEDIVGREEANPITHTAGEIAGFGAGLATDFGLPAVLGKAGSAVAHVAELAEPATMGAKLAKGAATAATEMGLYQANDEVTKAILDAPNAPGQIALNIGGAALLGGVTGPLMTGAGIAAKSALDNSFLKDFVDQYAFRKANPDPTEMMSHELQTAYSAYHEMGSEVGGVNGLKAQALEKLMPEMSEKLVSHAEELNSKLEKGIKELIETEDPHAKLLAREVGKYQSVVTNPEVTPYQMFDAAQTLKQQLQEWGKFNKNLVPLSEKNFRNLAKDLSYEVRTSLEDAKIWGQGVGGLQKELNAAWTKTIPAVKDIESKFMSKVGGEFVFDPAKLNTYLNQNGKATSQTIRQQMMGKFVEGMKSFTKAVDSAYEKAGVENPFGPIGLTSLEGSLEKKSVGSKLADLWYSKLESQSLGGVAGIAAGEAISPGFGGAYLGKEVLGPIFSSVLKPLMDKYPNVDAQAFHQALSLAKNIAAGNNKLINAAGNLFKSGTRILPTEAMPNSKQLEKLDKKAEQLNSKPEDIVNSSGKLGVYASDHTMALGKGITDVSAYLNSQRPKAVQNAPLDKKIEPGPMEKNVYARTLSIAQQPLVVLQHAKDGTIIPKDIVDLKAMYPELYPKMQQEILGALVKHAHDGASLPYASKMGISLLLGEALDSSMNPQAIVSAQPKATNQQPNSGNQMPTKPKKDTAKIGNKTNNLYKTPGQAAESDRSSRD